MRKNKRFYYLFFLETELLARNAGQHLFTWDRDVACDVHYLCSRARCSDTPARSPGFYRNFSSRLIGTKQTREGTRLLGYLKTPPTGFCYPTARSDAPSDPGILSLSQRGQPRRAAKPPSRRAAERASGGGTAPGPIYPTHMIIPDGPCDLRSAIRRSGLLRMNA